MKASFIQTAMSIVVACAQPIRLVHSRVLKVVCVAACTAAMVFQPVVSAMANPFDTNDSQGLLTAGQTYVDDMVVWRMGGNGYNPSTPNAPNPYDPTGALGYGKTGWGTALTSITTQAFLDEYLVYSDATGTHSKLVQSVDMPTSQVGANFAITDSGVANSNGQIQLSGDGHYIMVSGFNAPALNLTGSTVNNPKAIAANSSSTTGPNAVLRSLGRVNAAGIVNSSTATTDFSANNIRGVLSPDGNAMWVFGNGTATDGGVQPMTFGTINTTQNNINNNATFSNVRGASLYKNTVSGNYELYINTGKAQQALSATAGVAQIVQYTDSTHTTIATTTPTTSTFTTDNLLSGMGASVVSIPNEFYACSLNAASNGMMDTLYVCDSGTQPEENGSGKNGAGGTAFLNGFPSGGGIRKFCYVGATGTANGQLTGGSWQLVDVVDGFSQASNTAHGLAFDHVNGHGYFGLTGKVITNPDNSKTVQLYATQTGMVTQYADANTGKPNATDTSYLVSLTDNAGSSATAYVDGTQYDYNFTPTTIATAGHYTQFRGAVFAPTANPNGPQDLIWTGNSATWNTSNTNWSNILAPSPPNPAVAFNPAHPNNAGADNATFDAQGIGNPTITLGSAMTAGVINFNVAGYTLNGGGNTLTLTANAGTGFVANANATVNATIALGNSQGWIAASGVTLTINGNVSNGANGPAAITVAGDGVIAYTGSAAHTAGTTVQNGELRLAGSAAQGLVGNSTIQIGDGSGNYVGILSGNGIANGSTATTSPVLNGGVVSPGINTGSSHAAGTLILKNNWAFSTITYDPNTSGSQITALNTSPGGTYAWYLTANSTTAGTFDTINYNGGSGKSLILEAAAGQSTQATLSLNFSNSATSPDSGNAFWNTAHQWDVLTTTSGTTTGVFNQIANGSFNKGVFSQYRSGNDVFLAYTPNAAAAVRNLTWTGTNGAAAPANGSGVWDTFDNNLTVGGAATVYNSASRDNITFGSGSGSGTTLVYVGGPLSVGSMTFAANSPTYTIDGGSLKLYGGITDNNGSAGSWTTLTTNIALKSNQTWNIAAGKQLNYAGTLSGVANLTVAGGSSSSTLNLGFNYINYNSWYGTMNVTGGAVTFADINSSLTPYSPQAILRANPVNLASGTSLQTSAEIHLGQLSGSGTVQTIGLPPVNSTLTGTYGQPIAITTLGNATFDGTITTANATDWTTGISVYGVGNQTLTANASGAFLSSPNNLNIYGLSGLTLAGNATMRANLNGTNVSLNEGSLTIDNSVTNTQLRLYSTTLPNGKLSGSGRLNYIGNVAGDFDNFATLKLSAGAVTVNVVNNSSGSPSSTGTTITFDDITQSGGGTINFISGGFGTLGAADNPGANTYNPHVFTLAGLNTPNTSSSVVLINGIVGRQAGSPAKYSGSNVVGFALVNGSDYATYTDATGFQAYSAYTNITGISSPTDAAAVATSSNALVTGNTTIAGANANSLSDTVGFAVNTLKIAPTANGQSLTIASGTTLATLGLLATPNGGNSFEIDGPGKIFDVGSTRQIYVNSGMTLTINAKITDHFNSTGDSTINKAGAGLLVLGGTQTFDEQLRVTEGTVRVTLGTSLKTTTPVEFAGGQLELVGAGPGTTTSINFGIQQGGNAGYGLGYVDWVSSGGFSAYGGNIAIDLGDAGVSDLPWGRSNMFGDGQALVLGSPYADSRIEMTDNFNLTLNGTVDAAYAAREIRVLKNTSSTTDFARISGHLSGGVHSDLLKTGAGLLELTADNRTYNSGLNGGVLVMQGSLLVGATGALGNAPYTVLGATSGSNDAAILTSAAVTVDRDILVQAGSTGNTLQLGTSNYSQSVSAGINSMFTGYITLQNALQLASGTNGANNVTFSGTFDNSLGNAVSAAGSGTVTLTGTQLHGNGESMTLQGGALTYALAAGSTVSLGTTQKTITVNPGATLNVDATNVDPLTDSSDNTKHVNVVNNSNASFNMVAGASTVNTVTGSGTTNVGTTANNNPSLTANQIVQGTLNISRTPTTGDTSPNATVTINPSSPSNYIAPGNTTIPSGNSSGTSVLNSLSIANDGAGLVAHPAGPSTYYGTLDLKNNNLVIDYTGHASPVAQIRDAIWSAYHGGDWMGKGLTSSFMSGNPGAQYALAFSDNADSANQFSPFDNSGKPFDKNLSTADPGTPVNLHSVLVKFTWQDDLNMDGTVDISDAQIFANSYDNGATSGHTFVQGDLNYDGVVDISDAQIFANAYIITPQLATLPEPSSFVLAGLGLAGLLIARSRRRRVAK